MLETSLPGVFAVGDVRAGNVKRVASAVGEGSIAIHLVHRALGGASQARNISVEVRRNAHAECTHMDQIKIRKTHTHVCAECVKMGDTWVHLRLCMICGNVGCCDSSKNKHATKHFHAGKHPIMRSDRAGRRLGLVLRRRNRAGFHLNAAP